MIADVVYCRKTNQNATLLHEFILETELLLRFYDDLPESAPYFKQVRQACAALQQERNLREGSPNQRRALLAPLKDLNDTLYGLMGIAPLSLLEAISKYTRSIKIRLVHVIYCETNPQTRTALYRIIRGESLRALAKEYGIKETVLKDCLLNAAKALYQIGTGFGETADIAPAHGIPDLRTNAYRLMSEPVNLNAAARIALDNCVKFERHYGIQASSDVAKSERELAERYRKLH